MSTTYERMRAGLQHAKRRRSWASITELITNIQESRSPAFRRSSDGTDRGIPLKPASIRSALKWGITFGLLEEDSEGTVRLTDKGWTAAESDDDGFARQIRAAVKSHFENHGLPLDVVLELIDGITLPDVPDAETIANRAARRQPPPDLSNAELRTLLFMLSRATGLDRRVKVFYGRR